MKLLTLVNQDFRNALAKLARQPIPLKATFKLKGIIKRVEEEYKKYDECRQDALIRFGEKSEEGILQMDANNSVKLSADGMANFVKEIQELNSSEIDMPTISISELGENIAMTTEEIYLLDSVIVE